MWGSKAAIGWHDVPSRMGNKTFPSEETFPWNRKKFLHTNI